MSEPWSTWHTEQWFTSPRNHDRLVRDQLHVAPNVQERIARTPLSGSASGSAKAGG